MGVMLRDVEVEEMLKQAVEVEPLALQEEYVRVGADLAYWNERYAAALRHWMRLKVSLEREEAQVYLETRERLASANPKVTVGEVERSTANDEDLYTLKEKTVLAEVEKIRLHGVLSAINAKKDMLVSLGAHVRQEMDGDPSVRKMHAGYSEQQRSKG